MTDQDQQRECEHGWLGGIEVLLAGVMLTTTMLIAISGWQIMGTRFELASSAARAARTLAEADNTSFSDAVTVASIAGIDPGELTVRREAPSGNALGNGDTLVRCERVEVQLARQVDPVLLLWKPLTVVARHVEIVDPFASGLSGTASCV